MHNYYHMLGIDPNASPEAVDQAYQTALAQCDPGQFHSRYRHMAVKKFQTVKDAYRTLSDPGRRQAYDRSLAWQNQWRSVFASEGPMHRMVRIALMAVAFYFGYTALNSLLQRYFQPVMVNLIMLMGFSIILFQLTKLSLMQRSKE